MHAAPADGEPTTHEEEHRFCDARVQVVEDKVIPTQGSGFELTDRPSPGAGPDEMKHPTVACHGRAGT
jgi:hypothetical protein